MKYIPIIITILFFGNIGISQKTIDRKMSHDGLEREYTLYVPKLYSNKKAVPLVINFHGYTSGAKAQMNYGDFRPIADTANFLVVHPQGTLLDGKTHWNVGGWTYESKTDDVGFTSALIDEISKKYNIDMSRIYSTGMSNGGYMSFVLACQLGDRIAAIASVTGSMTPQTFTSCDPAHPTPIIQIHGTEDPTVPYDGNQLWTKPIDEVMQFWIEKNGCALDQEQKVLADVDKNDGSTVTRTANKHCDNNVQTIHYKVDGGMHNWPGSKKNRKGTNQDFNASLEIWKFFSQYELKSLSTGVSNY